MRTTLLGDHFVSCDYYRKHIVLDGHFRRSLDPANRAERRAIIKAMRQYNPSRRDFLMTQHDAEDYARKHGGIPRFLGFGRDGCMYEDPNFWLGRTAYCNGDFIDHFRAAKDQEYREERRKNRIELSGAFCGRGNAKGQLAALGIIA